MKKRLACVLALMMMVATNFGGALPAFAFTAIGGEMEVEEGDLYTDYDVSTWGEIFEVLEDDSESCVRLNFTSDIVKEVSDARLQIPEDKYVEINLNGYTLSLMSNGVRGVANYGDLVITGNGTINNGMEISGSYGLIDNYGSITIENGNFVDYGEGDGSSIKNRPGYDASLIIESGTFEGRGVKNGNACVYSDGILIISDGVSFTNASNRAYAVIVNSGRAEIGKAVGAIDNPVIVDGTHGSLGVNGGEVLINNGVYSAKNYYAIWITNNDGETNVDIKYGEFNGNLYGLRAGVDDGHQDSSDAFIRIEGGKFYGGTKAAIALTDANSERDWGLTISGGEYSTEPNAEYLMEGYVTGRTMDDTYPYMVVSATDDTDEYDAEYEEDEEIPLILPSKIDYNNDWIGDSGETEGHASVAIEFNKELIADRKAELSAVVVDTEGLTLDSAKSGELIGAVDINMIDRKGEVIEVRDNDMKIRIDIDEETYNILAGYDKLYVVYFDEDGNEVERINAELKAEPYISDGSEFEEAEEVMGYWIEFSTTHLSTYGVVGVSELEEEVEFEEASAPETGTMTITGASASVAALTAAVTVGVLTAIVSFAYLIRRRG